MVLAAVLEIILFSSVFIFVFQKLLICSEVLLAPWIIEGGVVVVVVGGGGGGGGESRFFL